ncbi:MAG TPA: hypothetical protein VNA28_04230, partial [Solirubrobacteraceae bacterium]|nr:hypothetical protein [Solirubrobacteraceae bacterium]
MPDAPEQRAEVVANGVVAAEALLSTWDWDTFRRECPERARGYDVGHDLGGILVRSPTGHENSFSLPAKRITAWYSSIIPRTVAS